MTRDDIIKMAREAGLPHMYQTGEIVNLGLVERFAHLVAAAERVKRPRQWQGLTEDEKNSMVEWAHPDIIEAIELRLRERNGG